MRTGPKYKLSIDTIEDLINQYFTETKIEDVTITGLCIHLNIHKDTFYDYAKKPEFKDILNMARMKVEHAYELSLRHNGRAGDIFALKNFGWKDKQEVDLSSKDFGHSLDKFVDKLGGENE